MDDKCPFCGAAFLKSMSVTTGLRKLYACYSVFENGVVVDHRNRSCYRGQIDNQAELLREAAEAVRERVKSNPWPAEKGGFASGCQYCGKPYPQPFSNADDHYDNCSWLKATILLPKLEAAIKEKS